MFFQRLINGWRLGMQSLQVLWKEKQLLAFPLCSGLACLIVLASFGLPLWNTEWMRMVVEEDRMPHDPLAYLLLFVFYFVTYFVIIYFNSALVACAIIRFRGATPTLDDGLAAANARLPQIAGWALVSATVVMILKAIENRSERAGQFVVGLVGMAWAAVTYFVVPVLVVERLGPLAAMRRSASILRRTWGETVAAQFSIGLVMTLGIIPAVLLMVLGAALAPTLGEGIFIFCVVLGVMIIVALSVVSAAAHTVLVAALYLYAAEDLVADGFEEDVLKGAFGAKTPALAVS